MNIKNDVWIGKKGFRFWYYRFRDSEYYSMAIIGIVVLACIFLIFNVIIPEVTQWFSIRDEVAATRQRISVLQQNINFMNNLDKNMLNNQLQTVSHALPPEKNFGLMLEALSNAAATSGVSLNDYSFQLGDLSSTQSPGGGQVQNNGTSSIDITVIINGNVDQVKKFIQSMQTNLPISQITSINGTGENVSVKLEFYQKAFPHVTFSGDDQLGGLSPKKEELLQTIAKWDNTTSDQQTITSSGSAETVPIF